MPSISFLLAATSSVSYNAINMATHFPLTNATGSRPSIPSVEEAIGRYWDLPSRPYFIARSSLDAWHIPSDLMIEINSDHRELRPVGKHPLCGIWNGKIDEEMHNYLVEQKVHYTSLDLVRLGVLDEATRTTPPVIVWVGVEPNTLSAQRGIEVAVSLRSVLLQHDINDVHVEIRASTITIYAKMYRPASPYDPTAQVREPFSTSLGISICAENTPDIRGTTTLFFTVPSKPGRLFLLAPRHVLFRENEHQHYTYDGSGLRRNVLLMGTDGFVARIRDIEEKIKETYGAIEYYKRVLNVAGSQSAKTHRALELENAESAVEEFEQFLLEAKQDWEDPENRIIGHVVLSPPFLLNAGNGGYMQDFAVVEIDPAKINATNFIGNAIDLGSDSTLGTVTLIRNMLPDTIDRHSFNYPFDRLIQFNNILSVNEMEDPSPENFMVLKHGCSSGLTTGRLNNVRSVLRRAFETRPGVFSREFAVLPRKREHHSFSEHGDSGAAVVNAWGAVAGMLTSGDGSSLKSDCTYITPIAFLLERLEELNFPANIFPTAADISV